MIYNILISGSRGFIGRSLTLALQQAGLTVIALEAWRALPIGQRPTAINFLHLANIHANPMANLALLQHTLTEVGPFITRWVQFQSAITLVGLGQPKAQRRNFGITPTCLDAYATGKLLQEDLLQQSNITSLLLCYLPLVIGPGGPWQAVQEQARQHGYTLPRNLPAHAYPQLLDLKQLSQQLIALLNTPPAQGCTRCLLANPTQPASWEAWLGPKRLPPPTLTYRQILRRMAARGRDSTLAIAAAIGILPYVARLLYGPVPSTLPPRHSTPLPRVPVGPWHPHGIIAHHLERAPQVMPQHNGHNAVL
jgi:hypothetical protein